MAGLKSGWSEWEESATDSMSQVKSAATQTFDGITQNMAAMLTGSEQNWRSFTRSVLSMMTEILLKQAMVGIVGSIGSAIGGGCWWRRIRVRRYSHSGRCGIPFLPNREDYRNGGKYMSQRGLFTVLVVYIRAASRIGVGVLQLMRGYAPAVMSVPPGQHGRQPECRRQDV